MELNARSGNIQATLNDGAGVGGTISANPLASSTLVFNMRTSVQSEYDNARLTLTLANAANGSLTINGGSYSWIDFDFLVNEIRFISQQKQKSQEQEKPEKEEDRGGGGEAQLNDEDEDVPVIVIALENQIVLKDPKNKKVLLTINHEDLPSSGDIPVLVATTTVMSHGEELLVSLYLNPDGTLEVVAGDYSCCWKP